MVTGIQLAVSLSPGSSASDRESEREREKWAEMGEKIEQESENGVRVFVRQRRWGGQMDSYSGQTANRETERHGHRQTKVRDYLKRQEKNRN